MKTLLAAVGLFVVLAGLAFCWWAAHTGRWYDWFPGFAPAPILMSADGNAAAGVIEHVVDGDTVAVRYHDLLLHVRLRNLDTPESVHPDAERNSDLGRRVSAWAKDRLAGQRVRLEFQRKSWHIATDKHGRALADLWIDHAPPGPGPEDELYQETVIRQGFSRYETGFGASERYHRRLTDADAGNSPGIWTQMQRKLDDPENDLPQPDPWRRPGGTSHFPGQRRGQTGTGTWPQGAVHDAESAA